MPHGPYQRTTGKEITQPVRLAETVDIIENAHLYLPQLMNIFYLSH
jgi:hypothetical protein